MLIKMSIECQSKCWSSINQHSTVDAVRTHNPTQFKASEGKHKFDECSKFLQFPVRFPMVKLKCSNTSMVFKEIIIISLKLLKQRFDLFL